MGLGVEDLFHHVIATLHSAGYRSVNAGALRMEWPRILLQGWPDGNADSAANALSVSAVGDRELVELLDSDTPVGWGHFGSGDAVMPDQGRPVERDYTAADREALSGAIAMVSDTTSDVYLNE